MGRGFFYLLYLTVDIEALLTFYASEDTTVAVTIEFSPVPVIHSATYHVFITGLTAAHAISVNTFQDAFADTPTTGTADADGNFACAITAQAALGYYVLAVTDTTAGQIVALTTFNNT